jgi:DNA invertase Pin-like site-specific DNA recombinase
VDGYVRTIDGAPEANAPSIQRWQIVSWAKARGWRLGRIIEEPPQARSAGATPALREALERVQARESDGIVVARLRAFGASLTEALLSIEQVQAAGGTFVSVCDGIDLSTTSGRLVLNVLESVIDW